MAERGERDDGRGEQRAAMVRLISARMHWEQEVLRCAMWWKSGMGPQDETLSHQALAKATFHLGRIRLAMGESYVPEKSIPKEMEDHDGRY